MESRDLWVELKPDTPSYMVLRGTYGEQVHQAFRISRQGVRWRFQRLFNDVYVSAFETILFIEKTFSTQLRQHAIRISRERYALRQEIARNRLQIEEVLQKRSREDRQDQTVKPAQPASVQPNE